MPGATAFVALRVAPGHPWPARHKGIHAQIRAPRIFSTLGALATIRGEKCGLAYPGGPAGSFLPTFAGAAARSACLFFSTGMALQ